MVQFNVQKRSENSVFCAFWLRNVLRATTACTSSTSQLLKSAPTFVCFAHFDIEMCFAPQQRALFSSLIWPDGFAPAALACLLFDPPEPQTIGKTLSRDFSTFSCTCIFFLLTLSLLWSCFFFSSLLFSDSSHLCFLFVHVSILSEVWLLSFGR